MKNLKFNFYKDWIFINLFNIISINWERKKVIKAIKGVFIPLKWHFKFTRKYAPFMYAAHYGKLFSIISCDVQWKDKFNDPRHEENPFTSIALFNTFFFNWEYKIPTENGNYRDDEDYWEQALWYLYYYKEYKCESPNIIEARKHWPWTRFDEKNDTWNDSWNSNFLVDKL